MRLYGKIIITNIKHHFFVPFLTAFGIFIGTLLMFNITALSAKEAAKPIEFFLCFAGVMLLTPVFYPEEDSDLRDVVSVRRIGYFKICGLRLLYSIVVLCLLVLLFVALMKERESVVTMAHVTGGIATALFLGSIGFFVAGVSDNTTLGYMAAMLYYLSNYGLKDKLGKLYLFSMTSGDFAQKTGLLLGAALFMGITLIVFYIRRRGVLFIPQNQS